MIFKVYSMCFLWVLSALFFSVTGRAHVSSIAAATAMSGRAAVEAMDTPFLNPAALPYQMGYFIGTGLSRFRSEALGDIDVFAISFTDNMPDTVVPTTFGFTSAKFLIGNQAWDRRDLRLAVGNYFAGRHALGFGVAYRNSRTDDVNAQQFNFYMGTMFAFSKSFLMAVVLDNLMSPSNGIPRLERLNPMTSLGISYNHKTFLRVKLDVMSESNNGWSRPTVAGGLENYWNRWLILRLGYQRNFETLQSISSAGVGFSGPKFGVHYALQNLQSNSGLDQRHSIDLGVPVW